MSEQDIWNRLGRLESDVRNLADRLDKVDTKLEKHGELVGDIKHIRANVAMMKKPVEDYERVKQRGIGMWTVVAFILGGGTIILNVISYIVRVYILKVGAP